MSTSFSKSVCGEEEKKENSKLIHGKYGLLKIEHSLKRGFHFPFGGLMGEGGDQLSASRFSSSAHRTGGPTENNLVGCLNANDGSSPSRPSRSRFPGLADGWNSILKVELGDELPLPYTHPTLRPNQTIGRGDETTA